MAPCENLGLTKKDRPHPACRVFILISEAHTLAHTQNIILFLRIIYVHIYICIYIYIYIYTAHTLAHTPKTIILAIRGLLLKPLGPMQSGSVKEPRMRMCL